LLPAPKPRRRRSPGRKPVDDRKVLCGILFVLHTRIRWEWLPPELGYGSGMTCWRRLRDWNNAGVWQHLHETLLAELRAADKLDLSRAVIDGSHVRALKGGPKPDRARSTAAGPGSKHHVICPHPLGEREDHHSPQRPIWTMSSPAVIGYPVRALRPTTSLDHIAADSRHMCDRRFRHGTTRGGTPAQRGHRILKIKTR
jgi:transposase